MDGVAELEMTERLTLILGRDNTEAGFSGLLSLVAQWVKNPPAVQETARDAADPGLVPGSGRSPGEGNGDPLHYSCLGNPMDRGASRAVFHGVAKKQNMT